MVVEKTLFNLLGDFMGILRECKFCGGACSDSEVVNPTGIYVGNSPNNVLICNKCFQESPMCYLCDKYRGRFVCYLCKYWFCISCISSFKLPVILKANNKEHIPWACNPDYEKVELLFQLNNNVRELKID